MSSFPSNANVEGGFADSSDDDDDLLKIICHHGGKFVIDDKGELSYANGSITEFTRFDPDFASWFEFERAIERLKYGGGIDKIWYKMPNESISNRKPLWEDPDRNIREMCEAAKSTNVVDVYIEHNVSEPDLVECPGLLEYPDSGGNGRNLEDDADDEKGSEEENKDSEEENGFDEETEVDCENETDVEVNDGEYGFSDFVDVHVGRNFECNVNSGNGDESDVYGYESDEGCPDTPQCTDEEWENFDKHKKVQQNPPHRGYRDVHMCLMQVFNIGDEFKDVLFRYSLGTGLPQAEHRMCARHIYANWRKHHKDKTLKPLFWQVAKSYNEGSYEENMECVRQLNPDAYTRLLGTNPWTWCRAFFQSTSHCRDVHNNLSESFNNTIKQARKKPLIDMLEDVRRQAMERIARRSVKADKWKGKFSPMCMHIVGFDRVALPTCHMRHLRKQVGCGCICF